MVDSLLGKFKINHLLSTPYRPQTNGLVERFNRTLCESLAKLGLKNNDWDLFIAPTLFAYRTTKHSTTKIEPFFLVYGRDARLPIDEEEVEDPINEKKRLTELVDKVPHIRETSRTKIIGEQQKQKDRHDKKVVKPTNFDIGDKVLYFRTQLDQSHSGKFEPKWKGPYQIHQILPNGVYKLKTLEGSVLATPINANLLKRYFDRQISQ